MNEKFSMKLVLGLESYHWFTMIVHLWFCEINSNLLYRPGARPTNDIAIEFEIPPKFAVL